jgi:hypothetical protein
MCMFLDKHQKLFKVRVDKDVIVTQGAILLWFFHIFLYIIL